MSSPSRENSHKLVCILFELWILSKIEQNALLCETFPQWHHCQTTTKPTDSNPETTKSQQSSSSYDHLPKDNATTRHMTLQITNYRSNRQPPLKSNGPTMLPPIQPSHCVLFDLFILLKPQSHAILEERTKTRLCIVQIVELVKNKAECLQP